MTCILKRSSKTKLEFIAVAGDKGRAVGLDGQRAVHLTGHHTLMSRSSSPDISHLSHYSSADELEQETDELALTEGIELQCLWGDCGETFPAVRDLAIHCNERASTSTPWSIRLTHSRSARAREQADVRVHVENLCTPRAASGLQVRARDACAHAHW